MKNYQNYVIGQLQQFISYETISSDNTQQAAMLDCARWIKQQLLQIGMQYAKIFKTKSHPVVFASYIQDPSFPCVLFYGHYDVQPVDPLSKWSSPPFTPAIRGEYIYGRGASDDKGQMFIHIKAVESMLKMNKKLPVNIKFLIEGAEEIGSIGLKDFIALNKNLLQCDVAIVSDTKMISLNEPAITYSLRGSLSVELCIQTSKKDVHSGTFGGFVPNAAIVLSDLISKLHDKDNIVAIPGFYDNVETVTPEERVFIRMNGISDENLAKDAGSFFNVGEKNYSMHERGTFRPSLSVTGITSGYQGSGVKNVIPSTASAKINFRLVPGQRPERIKQLFDKYVKNVLPYGVQVKTVYGSFANPVTVPRNNLYVLAAAKAYDAVFQHPTKLLQNGGTIAAVDYLHSILKIPVVLMGFAQASDNMHAPNEKFYLPNLFRGIDTIISFLRNISILKNKKRAHVTAHY